MLSRKRGFKHFYRKGLLDVDPISGCWIFLGTTFGGYPRASIKRGDGHWARTTAHRYFWTVYRGDPGDKEVAHRCHRRRCVNPRHLRLDTRLGNLSDWFVDQQFTDTQKDEVWNMFVADLPISVIADRMMAPRPYIHRLVRKLEVEKTQFSLDFDFHLEAQA